MRSRKEHTKAAADETSAVIEMAKLNMWYRELATKRGSDLHVSELFRESLRRSLFSMARRAAYWRWAYRDARARVEVLEYLYGANSKSLGHWRAKWSLADQQATAYHGVLREIASHACLHCHPSSCVETDRAVEFCDPCIARSALGWSRDLGWSR